MTNQNALLVERLCAVENPRELVDWESRDGHYLAACRVSAEDVPGLIDIVRKWGDPEWLDDESEPEIDQEGTELLPVTAWRALADLKAEAASAVEPLVEMLCDLDDEFDDWASEELPHVFGKIGPTAISPLTRLAADESKPDFIRSIAALGLRRVAHYHADSRDQIVACLTELLASAAPDHWEFNSTLFMELVELRAVEAAEPIERAFAGNLLDVGMMGDWETVRRELGVEGLGLAMPAHPYNSIEQFRASMGIGVFSKQALFTDGELDYDAAQAYYERAYDAFSQSSEGRQVIERNGQVQWFRMLLDFGLSYLGETVDQMTPGSVSEFIFEHVPRKVSTEADSAPAIIGELVLFWEYLDRVYKLPAAESIVQWLKADDLVAQLKAELSDPANFGMAKAFFMSGKRSGFDMTSEAGAAEFLAAYNRSLNLGNSAALPVEGSRRVGRNEPCPCGSGKKFKKCCLRSS